MLSTNTKNYKKKIIDHAIATKNKKHNVEAHNVEAHNVEAHNVEAHNKYSYYYLTYYYLTYYTSSLNNYKVYWNNKIVEPITDLSKISY